MRVIKTDVAIMGSGITGLSAAFRARRAGLDVAVFEKRPFQGGAVSNAPIIIQVTRPGKEYQQKAFETFMDYTNWAGDPHVVHTWIRYMTQIPEFINIDLNLPFAMGLMTELDEMGVKGAYGGNFDKGMNIGDYYILKGIGQGHGAAAVLKKARQIFEKEGGKLYTNMPITELIREEDRVTGAYAHDTVTNEDVKIEAKAVVVASGGAICDKEMMKDIGLNLTDKDCSDGGNLIQVQFSNGQMTGDGIKAIWNVGGKKTKLWPGTGTNLPNPGPAGPHIPWSQPTQLMTLVEQPFLTVNKYGERFVSENYADNHMVKFTTFYNQPDKAGYLIFDADVAEKMKNEGVDNFYFIFENLKIENVEEQFQQCIDMGNEHFFIADTIEELCEKIGIDEAGLKETIEKYNKACDEGYDDEFFVKKEFLYPVRKPKFFACKPCVSGYSTIGGVRINGKCQVLDDDLRPIPGLYAGGDIAQGSMFGETPYGATSVACFCFATGFAIADQLAETLK